MTSGATGGARAGAGTFRAAARIAGGLAIANPADGRLAALGRLPWPMLSLGGALVTLPFLVAEGSAGTYLPGHPFILVLPAILAATVMFRWPGGIASLAAACLYIEFSQLDPFGALRSGSSAEAVAFAVFLGIGLYVVAVISSLQGAMARQARLLSDVAQARDRSAAAERENALLVDELDHRIRNAIASLASVVRHTLRASDTLDAFEASFERRIAALVRTHDIIARNGLSGGAGMREVLEGEFAPFAGAVPCDLDGPEIRLGPRSALSLCLALHELATNAAKYGGLSPRGSGLSVSWRVDGAGELGIDWRERVEGGARPSARRGSGTRLLDHTVSGLGGRVERDYGEDGLALRIAVPVSSLGR